MTVTRLKSLHPETEFGPSWDIPIYHSTWNDEKVGKIKKWLIQNEKTFLDLPARHDAATGLGEDSVTSRFGQYNLFDYRDDLPELEDLLNFFRWSYINFIQEEQSFCRDLDIVCWFNLLRCGEEIKEHNHGAGHDVYLSGNMHLDNYSTCTYYVSPFDDNIKYPFLNKKGCLTIFPTYVSHGASKFEEQALRLSIAFDLKLKGIDREMNSIEFMNKEIYESMCNVPE
jgi:hypothetical protein